MSDLLAASVNGLRVLDPAHALSLEDRGLAFGDGIFETISLRNGSMRFFSDHYERMRTGCERLALSSPTQVELLGEIESLLQGHRDGIVKVIVTRGVSGRGYRAAPSISPTRVVMLYRPIAVSAESGLTVRWCTTRLARNSQLAGIKHLNRIEHVLAQLEWHDPAIGDGLLLDTEGEVVESVTSNVFAVIGDVLSTPDLRFCGVRGVMRQRVLAVASRMGVETWEGALRPEELLDANELFLTNAIRGIRPICRVDNRQWPMGRVTQQLVEALEREA